MSGNRNFCSAINCINSAAACSLSLFRVPKDPKRSREWIQNSGRRDLMDKSPIYCYNNIKFCADHFEPSMFMSYKRNSLIKTAVPTLFVDKKTLKSGKNLVKMRAMDSPKVNQIPTEIVTEKDFVD